MKRKSCERFEGSNPPFAMEISAALPVPATVPGTVLHGLLGHCPRGLRDTVASRVSQKVGGFPNLLRSCRWFLAGDRLFLWESGLVSKPLRLMVVHNTGS